MSTPPAYKDNEVIYTDAIEVNLTNDKDFLMYDWDDISDAAIGTVPYNNFIIPELCLISRAGFVGEVPYAIVTMDKGMNVEGARTWLYDYVVKLYKEPLYSESEEVKAKYNELFASADVKDTPLYIWKDSKSVVALIKYDYGEGRWIYYIKAEPVK